MDELSDLQRSKQRISKETAKAQKQLKVDEKTISYHLEGNKIIKVFKKNNGNKYSKFIGFREVKDKKSPVGKKILTPEFLQLQKEGYFK